MSGTQRWNDEKGAATALPGHTLRTRIATLTRRIHAASAGGRLHGRTLLLARAAWLALAAVTIGLYVASLLPEIEQLQAPCRVSPSAPITALPPADPVCPHGQVSLAVARALAGLHLSVGFVSWYVFGLEVLFVAGFATIAALIFWRRSHDPMALYVSISMLIFACLSFRTGPIAQLAAPWSGWRLPVETLQFFGAAAFGILGFIFPDGRFVPHWTLLGAAAIALWFLPSYLFPGSAFDFNTWPALVFFSGWAILWCVIAAAQVYRYGRIYTPTQRLQTKWVVFGICAAGVGYIGGRLVEVLVPAPTSPAMALADPAGGTLIFVGFLLIPITIGIAILRHHLFDIDLIIKQTLIYTLLAATLALLYESGALVVEKVLLAFTGQESLVAAVAIAFGVGALAEPLHHRIKRDITRIFYPRKYEAEHRIDAFSQQVRRELKVATVPERMEAAVEARLRWRRPDHADLADSPAPVPPPTHSSAGQEDPAALVEQPPAWPSQMESASRGGPSPLSPHPLPPP